VNSESFGCLTSINRAFGLTFYNMIDALRIFYLFILPSFYFNVFKIDMLEYLVARLLVQD
jgi:hypothetical protein